MSPDFYNRLGIACYEEGRFEQAESAFMEALSLDPFNAETYSLLGTLLDRLGRYDEAALRYRKATYLRPGFALANYNLGNTLCRVGKLEDALSCYRHAVSQDPNLADAYNGLGVALKGLGRLDEAVDNYRRALALKPDYVEVMFNLAVALQMQNRLEEALEAYRRILALRPSDIGALYNLGLVLQAQGKPEEAVKSYQQAVALCPDFTDAHNKLGEVLHAQGRVDDAVRHYQKALAHKPDMFEAHYNLGLAHVAQGKFDEAAACFRQALALEPSHYEAHHNLCIALQEAGLPDEAISCCRLLLAKHPDSGEERFNLACLTLLRGELSEGFKGYEWRFARKEPVPRRRFPQPLWDGSDLEGRTILLHTEQGLGDTIMMARYASLVAECGGRVLLESPGELSPLLKNVPGVELVVPRGEKLPPFDLHLPLMSLPMVFGTTLETIPASVPYIIPSPGLVESWGEKLAHDGRFKVGLAWKGRQDHPINRKRSCPLEHFAPFKTLPGVAFYSLQGGDKTGATIAPPEGMELIDLTAGIRDFADTAALIANLDLVISIDTSVAHLAGAVAAPVWVMLPFVPDWRWLLGREGSPWYPTMRLFRQEKLHDWPGVIGKVKSALLEVSGENIDNL